LADPLPSLPRTRGRGGRGQPKMLINERGVREHIAAATAALNQPGGGKGAVMAEEGG
jgi:hypothetical protein